MSTGSRSPSRRPVSPSPIAGSWLQGFGVLLLCLGLMTGAVAWATPFAFKDAAEEARFQNLAGELRCVMCQNQSLADSSAGIAADLRQEVFKLMQAGHSDAEIRDFMVARYGDFVLYRPPLEPRTWLLWFAPVLGLLVGACVLWRILAPRAKLANREAGGGPPAEQNGDTGEEAW